MSKQNRAGYEKKFLAGIEIWNTWLAEATASSDQISIAECRGVIEEMQAKNANFIQALDAYDQTGLGVTFVSDRNESWAMIILDPTENTARIENSSFRFQLYDRSGFLEHATYPSPYAALAEAFEMGYTKECVSQLDDLAFTQQWKKGMDSVHTAQQSWHAVSGSN